MIHQKNFKKIKEEIMKIALVTGASAGFGAAICRELIKLDYKVIGTARRMEKLEALQDELGQHFCPFQLDITDGVAIDELLTMLPSEFQPVDILVNNAGLALGMDVAQDAKFSDWETMVQTNVLGLIKLTHVILPQMVERNQGYIINVGSTAGTYAYKAGNVYGATKAFVKQFSLNLRTDLLGKKIRVTNIEPGLCGGTEFSNVRFNDDERAKALYEGVESVSAQDIAKTVAWLVSMPEHFNVNSMEIMPVAQASGGLAVIKNI